MLLQPNSITRCLAALIAMLVISAALVTPNLGPLFPPGDAGALAAALLAFFISAVIEETAKATGIGLQALNHNRTNWFWIALVAAGLFGAIERTTGVFYTLPEYRPASGVDWAWEIAAIVFHIALSLVAVSIARVRGGGWLGWSLGVLAAAALHFAYNILQYEYVMLGLCAAIIVCAFTHRSRLDWRSPDYRNE